MLIAFSASLVGRPHGPKRNKVARLSDGIEKPSRCRVSMDVAGESRETTPISALTFYARHARHAWGARFYADGSNLRISHVGEDGSVVQRPHLDVGQGQRGAVPKADEALSGLSPDGLPGHGHVPRQLLSTSAAACRRGSLAE